VGDGQVIGISDEIHEIPGSTLHANITCVRALCAST